MHEFELVLRTVAVLLLVLLAALLCTAQRRTPASWSGALFAAAAAAFVVTSARGAPAALGMAIYPLTALCVSKAALLWLFSRSLFEDSFRVRPRDLLVIALTVLYGSWQQLVHLERERAGIAAGWEIAASLGFEALLLTLVLLALASAWRELSVDLVDRRRRIRWLFITITAGYLAATVLVQGYHLLFGTATPAPLTSANLLLIVALSFATLRTLLQRRPATWLETPTLSPGGASLGGMEQRLLVELERAMEREHLYRNETLTIAGLARRLGTREHVLRALINRGLGFRNFNDFLHSYRIREACARLQRPEAARLPITSLALEVGYASIGPFNRAFKARVGVTPTHFRRSAQRADGLSD